MFKLIEMLIMFIIDMFFEKETITLPQVQNESTPVEPNEIRTMLEERFKQLNQQLANQSQMSWSEYKKRNALVNQYFIQKEVIP